MIAYLKGLGYKYTTKDTLNHKEFRLVEETVEMDLERTVTGLTRTTTTSTYELFLSTKSYSTALLQGIVSGANDNGEILLASAGIVEIQERGFLIQLNFEVGN